MEPLETTGRKRGKEEVEQNSRSGWALWEGLGMGSCTFEWCKKAKSLDEEPRASSTHSVQIQFARLSEKSSCLHRFLDSSMVVFTVKS